MLAAIGETAGKDKGSKLMRLLIILSTRARSSDVTALPEHEINELFRSKGIFPTFREMTLDETFR